MQIGHDPRSDTQNQSRRCQPTRSSAADVLLGSDQVSVEKSSYNIRYHSTWRTPFRRDRWEGPKLLRICILSLVLAFSGLVPAQAADLGPTNADGPAIAETTIHPFFRHRFMFQAGAAFNTIDSGATVGPAGGSDGTSLDLEEDLGFPSSRTAFDALVRYRISDRWMIEGEYFNLPRDSSATASGSIDFGRLTFPVSASVKAEFDIQSIRLAAGYAFFKSTETEVGAALSVYATDLSLRLSGNASIGGIAAGFQTEKFTVGAPIPTLGLYASHAVTSRWLISGRADYMNLHLASFKGFGYDLDDVSAEVLSLEASTEYRLAEHLAVGVAYRYMDVSMGATSGGDTGQLDYKVSAPIVFVRASF
jgi:opacity protein-like surface antigen